MIFNVVRQPVRAKYADEFPTLIAEYIAASQAEPGNLFFDWYRSADDPNLWMLLEGFRDTAAGKAHVSLTTSRPPWRRCPDFSPPPPRSSTSRCQGRAGAE